MLELDAKFPGYDFAHNKGYGAKPHITALQKLGATPWHRHSFAPAKSMTEIPEAVSLYQIIRLK